jgi:hypothetical protein
MRNQTNYTETCKGCGKEFRTGSWWGGYVYCRHCAPAARESFAARVRTAQEQDSKCKQSQPAC